MRDVVTKCRRLSLAGRKPKISPAYEKLTALLLVYPMSPALLAWYSGSSPEGWRPGTSKIYQQSHTFCFPLFFFTVNLQYKMYRIPKLKCFSSRLARVFVWSIEARYYVENEDVVGAAPVYLYACMCVLLCLCANMCRCMYVYVYIDVYHPR